jgi:hypothetical protein
MYIAAAIHFRIKNGNVLSAIVTKHCVSLHTNSIISPAFIVALLYVNTCNLKNCPLNLRIYCIVLSVGKLFSKT